MLHRKLIPLLIALVACHETTAPAAEKVVPAGASDVAWASIGKTCTPAAPTTIVPANKRDSLPAFTHGIDRSVDDDWADAARVIPGGWGGLFLQNSIPTIFLVDINQRDAAVAALRARGIGSTLDLNQTRALPGRWDFAQLADWFRYLDLHVFTLPSVRGADIQEVRNRIEYDVPDQASRTSLETLLARLGLPCYLVAINIVGSN